MDIFKANIELDSWFFLFAVPGALWTLSYHQPVPCQQTTAHCPQVDFNEMDKSTSASKQSMVLGHFQDYRTPRKTSVAEGRSQCISEYLMS